MIDDEPFDEAEQHEASALAEAIERGHALDFNIADAFDAAEFVAVLKAPALDEQRFSAVFAQAELRISAARRRARSRRVWFGSAVAALAVAAAAMLMVREQPAPTDMRAEESMAVSEPAASAAGGGEGTPLRAAQIAWLNAPSPTSAAVLERELAAHRNEQLSALQRRYAR
jgi:hypothetical protein